MVLRIRSGHVAVTVDHSNLSLESIIGITEVYIVYTVGFDRKWLEENNVWTRGDWARKCTTG
jgi:hypothetical protein